MHYHRHRLASALHAGVASKKLTVHKRKILASPSHNFTANSNYVLLQQPPPAQSTASKLEYIFTHSSVNIQIILVYMPCNLIHWINTLNYIYYLE